MIKNLVQKVANQLGYEIRKKNDRQSLFGILKQISKNFTPSIVIDVGAAFGSWSSECSRVFSDSQYVLIEPLQEYEEQLKKICLELKNTSFVSGCAGSRDGEQILHVHEDLVGSSFMSEIEGAEVDGKERVVKTITLDTLVREKQLKGKYLIKIDVQGAELEVLAGAQNLLSDTECLILEVSLFRSFVGGADLYDIVEYMKKYGFVAYDIASLLYRPYDNALCQFDMVFVRETGMLRKFLGYATLGQRREQNEKFKKFNSLLK
jgi:FkbM family methyltransferase